MDGNQALPKESVPGAVAIRPMARDDLPAVLAIEEAVFPSPWPRSVFLHEMRSNRRATLVVAQWVDQRQVPQVIGYAGFWAVAGEMHVTTLAVHPRLQRRGVAHQLMDHCFQEARAQGCTYAILEVRESNEAAQRLYASYGFVVTGRRKRYYHDGEDALIMTREGL